MHQGAGRRLIESMAIDPTADTVALVAACTAAAAHRRDHQHLAYGSCHPHAVEVGYLGHRAMTVCHDCGRDWGFLPEREA